MLVICLKLLNFFKLSYWKKKKNFIFNYYLYNFFILINFFKINWFVGISSFKKKSVILNILKSSIKYKLHKHQIGYTKHIITVKLQRMRVINQGISKFVSKKYFLSLYNYIFFYNNLIYSIFKNFKLTLSFCKKKFLILLCFIKISL